MAIAEKAPRHLYIALCHFHDQRKILAMNDAFLAVCLPWELQSAFISDHDSKFLSEFRKMLFCRAGIKILIGTTYHRWMGNQNRQIKLSR